MVEKPTAKKENNNDPYGDQIENAEKTRELMVELMRALAELFLKAMGVDLGMNLSDKKDTSVREDNQKGSGSKPEDLPKVLDSVFDSLKGVLTMLGQESPLDTDKLLSMASPGPKTPGVSDGIGEEIASDVPGLGGVSIVPEMPAPEEVANVALIAGL